MGPELVGHVLACAATGEQVGVDLDVSPCVREHQVVATAKGAEQVCGDVEAVASDGLLDRDALAGGFCGADLAPAQLGCGSAVTAQLELELLAVGGRLDDEHTVGPRRPEKRGCG
ncbi:MAG TPA: hypothetical protein VNS19_21665 [Acidimicrobiales bacterium]|nr:hypothetical protein [Acidimicrobiales bacterium]